MAVSSRVLARPDTVTDPRDLDELEIAYDYVEVEHDDQDGDDLVDDLDDEGVDDELAVELIGAAADPFALAPGPRVGARQRGKFVAELDEHQLLDALAAVAKNSGAKEPGSLSKREWNYARVEQGRLDLPTAESIRQRCNRPWVELLRIALSPLDDRGRHLGWNARGDEYTDAMEIPVDKALRAVAHRLKCIPSQAAYDIAVKEIEAESRRGRTMIHLHLPISATVIDRVGSWKQAIVKAKLTQAQRERKAPPPLLDALDAIVSEHGVLPSRNYVRNWVIAHDIPVSYADMTTPYEEQIAQLRERRRACGESTPTTVTTSDKCPPLPEPPERFQHRRNSSFTEAECVASVRLFLAELPRGLRPTSKVYQAFSARNTHLRLLALKPMKDRGWRWQQLLAAARKP
jgi:hypothetical protein